MKIYAFHLLNDYSGSPKVLAQVLKNISQSKEVVLQTSVRSSGFLSNIPNITYIDNGYSFKQNKLVRLFHLFYIQLKTILIFLKKVKKHDIVYINTVLPFGAAIMGKLKGAQVIYHLHETSIRPILFKKFLFYIVRLSADHLIYVSNYLRKQERINLPSTVIYNALEKDYFKQAQQKNKPWTGSKSLLMICSLKAYKGVLEYTQLASDMPDCNFELVVNASKNEIKNFFKGYHIPKNLALFPKQSCVKRFYAKSDLVLNLSRPDEWIETFGLTAIEAMAYGKPVVVPPLGGIAEIVTDGYDGYKVSSRNTDQLKKRIRKIFASELNYELLAQNAKKTALKFSELEQTSDILTLLNST